MLERDNMQKSEFLKALSDMWKDFDSRVLRYKVLPPLCAELRNLVVQPMILHMVLTIAESQDRTDFELSTLPALIPVLGSASGETLLLLVKHAELIINKSSQENLISNILPLLVRAYEETDPRIQEEALKKSVPLAKQLDVQLVKQTILPHVHGLALKTTVAAVRVSALLCLGDLVHALDKHAVLDILQTIQRCTAVDRSAPTLMCSLGVANSILKQYGVEFVAEHVLPLLVPLLTAQQLNIQQFAKFMLFVKDILRMIEEKKGVTVTDSGIPEVKPAAFSNGLQSQALSKTTGTVAPASKSGKSSWDENWGLSTKRPGVANQPSLSNPLSTPSVLINGLAAESLSSQPEALKVISTSNQQTATSCTPVDIEWPPRASSGKQSNAGTASSSTLDDTDPFADWPPRTSSTSSASRTSNNVPTGPPLNNYSSSWPVFGSPDTTNPQSNGSNSWAFNMQGSFEPSNQSRGATPNSSSINK